MASYNVNGKIKVEVFVIPVIYGPDHEDYSVISHILLKIIPKVVTMVVEAWYRREPPTDVKLLYNGDPELEPDKDYLFMVKVIAYGLCVRAGPRSDYPILNYVKENDVLRVYKVENGWYKIDPEFYRWTYGRYTQTLTD